MEDEREFRSGFAAIIGRPNVGKSTLLNALVGRKVAIVSDKAQTTRHRIRGVLHREDAQVVFVDTPGIHKPRHLLGRYLVEAALGTLKDVDVILLVVEPEEAGPGDEFVLRQLADVGRPVLLVINKIDRVARPALLPLIDHWRRKFSFAEIVPVSARTGENLDRLADVLVTYLPPGPPYYPADIVSDQPEQVVLAELVREKILHLTAQEVPHSVAVTVDEVARRPQGVVYIRATIFTERESQKAILIGQEGRMLKRIGQLARAEIEPLLKSRVYLDLWVKVRPGWRRDEVELRRLGLVEK
ncbi:MAG: GTPase Era [Bacillota bacterium]